MRLIDPRVLTIGATVIAVVAAGFALTLPETRSSETVQRAPRAMPARTTLAKPSFKPSDQTIAGCEKLDGTCQREAWGNLAFTQGPEIALRELERARSTGAVSDGACHLVVHGIGEAAFARQPDSVARLIAGGTQQCSAGYYHGVLDDALRAVPADRIAPIAREICADPALAGPEGLRNACGHGIGHGLMAKGGRDVQRALTTCDQLEERDQSWCWSGAFMEFFSKTPNQPAPGPAACAALGARYEYDCYIGSVDGLRANVGENWPAIARACDRLATAWIDTCHLALGRHVGTFHAERPARIARACAASGRRAHICTVHAASQAVGVRGRIDPAIVACSTQRSEHAAQCWRMSGGVLFGNDGLAAARAGCSRAPRAYRATCMEPSR